MRIPKILILQEGYLNDIFQLSRYMVQNLYRNSVTVKVLVATELLCERVRPSDGPSDGRMVGDQFFFQERLMSCKRHCCIWKSRYSGSGFRAFYDLNDICMR